MLRVFFKRKITKRCGNLFFIEFLLLLNSSWVKWEIFKNFCHRAVLCKKHKTFQTQLSRSFLESSWPRTFPKSQLVTDRVVDFWGFWKCPVLEKWVFKKDMRWTRLFSNFAKIFIVLCMKVETHQRRLWKFEKSSLDPFLDHSG